MHYAAVQRASTALHVCEVRPDKTKPDRTHTMEVRSGEVRSGEVRSGQAKQYVPTHTRIHCIPKTSIQR